MEDIKFIYVYNKIIEFFIKIFSKLFNLKLDRVFLRYMAISWGNLKNFRKI